MKIKDKYPKIDSVKEWLRIESENDRKQVQKKKQSSANTQNQNEE